MRSKFSIIIFLCILVSHSWGQIPPAQPIITEFLANPSGDLHTEWVEIYLPGGPTIDLSRYQIGDSWHFFDIEYVPIYLDSGEYIILVQDVFSFLDYYTKFNGRVVGTRGWPILNDNDSDAVRLANSFGTVIDSVFYEDVFDDNRSWERYINPGGQSYWGASFAASGSSPGQPNSYYYPRTNEIDLSINPDPFSPDGDGFEDETTISFDLPEAESFELSIYDISGRKVRNFYQAGLSYPGSIVWDGRDDDGRRLPVGIYIIYASVEGGSAGKVKKTVVIAR